MIFEMEKLKQIRLEQHITHQEMSNALGISKTFYWQIENEQRRLSYQMAFRIASIFHLKPDDLFYLEFQKKLQPIISED